VKHYDVVFGYKPLSYVTRKYTVFHKKTSFS